VSPLCDRVRTSIGCEQVRCRQYSYTCNTCAVFILAVDLDGGFGGSVSGFARPRGRLADHYFCLLAPSRVLQAVHRPGTRACARADTHTNTHTNTNTHAHAHTYTHTHRGSTFTSSSPLFRRSSLFLEASCSCCKRRGKQPLAKNRTLGGRPSLVS